MDIINGPKITTSIIACVAKNGIIGNQGILPWKNSEEMKFFKEKTTNHPVIMGRKTFESIGSPLKNRFNIVITSNTKAHNIKPDNKFGPVFVGDIIEAIDLVDELTNEVFIIGGRSIYETALNQDLVDKMYLNVLDQSYEGDCDFPYYNLDEWITIPSEIKYNSFKSYTVYKKRETP